MATMREFIQRLPKCELHVHLEGSLDEETLCEIAPSLTREDVRARYRFEDFAGFLKSFGWVVGLLREPEHYAIATRRLLARLEEQNVRYAEITLSAGVVLWKGQDLDAIHEAVVAAAAQSSVETHWIWDAVRQWGTLAAWQVVEMAAAHSKDGVVACGLGGDELRGPARDYRAIFDYARDHGLRLVCHAGEVGEADSVWQALEIGAERIGHGIASASDPALLEHLARNRIPLEVCPTSNLRTGALDRFERHPLGTLLASGVHVVLGTDDPPMFGATLCGEYEFAAHEFALGEEALEQLARDSFRHAFGWNRPFPEAPPPCEDARYAGSISDDRRDG